MKHDKFVAFVLLYWMLYSGVLHVFVYWNEIFSIIPDLMLIYLYLRVCRYKKAKRISKYIHCYIPILCVIFIMAGTISMLFNGGFIFPYMWNLRFYLRPLLVFFVIWQMMHINDCWKFRKIMYYAFLPNLFFCFLEYMTGRHGDALGGIFGGGNREMVLYIMPMIFFAVADYYQGMLSKLKFYGIVVVSLFLSFLGEIKLLYIVVPLFWYIGYVLFHKSRLQKIVVLIVVICLFVPVMQYLLSFFYDQNYVDNVFTMEQLQVYTSENSFIVGQEDGMNRSSSIRMTGELILKDTVHKLFGYGIGASSVSSIFNSPIGSKYMYTFFFLFSPSYLLVETGWVGFTIFLCIYVLLLLTFIQYYRKSKDRELKYWSSLGIMGTLFTFILLWYNNSPILTYLIFFYFFAVCFVAIRDRLKILILQHK